MGVILAGLDTARASVAALLAVFCDGTQVNYRESFGLHRATSVIPPNRVVFPRHRRSQASRRGGRERAAARTVLVSDVNVIATMTTIPSRIARIRPVVESVLNQTWPVERLELNVPYYCVRTGEYYVLPGWLLDTPRVSVFRTQDLGSMTKIAPTLLRHKVRQDLYVWSVDDDMVYAPTELAALWEARRDGQFRILTRQAAAWIAGSFTSLSGECDVAHFEGYGGVLYPPGCVGDDFERYVAATTRNLDCRTSDDAVLSFYFAKHGVPIHLYNPTSDGRRFDPNEWQAYGLESDELRNQGGGNGERALRAYDYLGTHWESLVA